MKQNTLKNQISINGVCLHSGSNVFVTLYPSIEDSGITFSKNGSNPVKISSDIVEKTPLCSRIRIDNEYIDTVEHLMAALRIMNIDNIHIDLHSGNEIPILDGSAKRWIDIINYVGIKKQNSDRVYIDLIEDFDFQYKESLYCFRNGNRSISVNIDFKSEFIGKQSIYLVENDYLLLSDSRTFVMEDDINYLRTKGLALGGSLNNAVVVGKNGVLNRNGWKYSNEAVKHKALDLVGDLYLLGNVLNGSVIANRPGHSATCEFIKKINEMKLQNNISETLVA